MTNTYIIYSQGDYYAYYYGNPGLYNAMCYSINSFTACVNSRAVVVVQRDTSTTPNNWAVQSTSNSHANNFQGFWFADLVVVPQPTLGNTYHVISALMNSVSASSTSTVIYIGRFYVTRGGDISYSQLRATIVSQPQSKCYRIFLDSGASPNRYIAACSNGIMTIGAYTSSDGSSVNGANANSVAFTSVGVGDYTTGLIIPGTRRLYLGSSIGLAFEVDLTTLSLLRVTLLSSGGLLSPFTGVVLDSPTTSPFGVLYWGTADGSIARVNLRDFSTFSSASLGVEGGMTVTNPTISTNMTFLIKGTSNSDANSLYVLGAGPFSGNNNYYRSYRVSMVDCSIYSCTTCNSNPIDLDYCGWCVTTGTCTRVGACSPSANWQQNQTCPQPVSLTPSTGSTAGGTLVIYFGTNFGPSGSYACRWGAISTTTPASVIPVSGGGTPTAVYCLSPPTGLVAGVPVSLSILFTPNGGSQRVYSDALAFTPYSCSSATTCSDCQSLATRYSECGWCFKSATCTAKSTCTSSTTTSNEWGAATCPSISSIGSASASGATATPVTESLTNANTGSYSVSVAVSGWVFPPVLAFNQYRCLFTAQTGSTAGTSTTAVVGAVTSASASTGRITCQLPNTITSIGTAIYGVSVVTASSTTQFIAPGPATGLTIFSCPAINSCYECNIYSACTWCVNPTTNSTSCLAGTSATCPTGASRSTTCSKVTSVSPQQASLDQIESNASFKVTVTGSSLDLASANLQRCYFISGSTIFTSTMEAVTSTSTVCPFPTGITAGNWSLSLGSASSRQTQAFPFFIYQCSLYTTCGTCTTSNHPFCNWCLDIDLGGPANGNTGCADTTHDASTCSAGWLTERNVCPAITFAAPSYFPLSGNGTVTLTGSNLMIAENNVSEVACRFYVPPLTSTGSSTDIGVTSTSWSTVESGVACNVPATTSAVTAAVELVASANHSQLFATSTSISYITCSSFSSCDSCMAGESFCVWCGATCTDTCSTEGWQASVCPNVTSVSPDYSATAGGEPITIFGSGFLTSSGSKKKDSDASDSARRWSSETASVGAAGFSMSDLVSGAFGSHKRAVSDMSGLYTCDFGGIQSAAEVNAAGTEITCTSPAKSAGSSILNVLFNGSTYLTTPGMTYFTCSSSSSTAPDTCTSPCTVLNHCGWCVVDGSCSSQTQCRTAENSLTPVWQENTCTSATLNRDQFPTAGKFPVTATLTSKLPTTVVVSDLQCVFGSEVFTNATSLSTATVFDSATNTSTNVTTITCPTPSSAATTTTFSLTYKAKSLTTEVDLVYADCSIYSDCTRCLSIPYCGWCGSGNKCTMDVQCTGTWSRRSCPANKVAIGVGVGIGLFVLILLVLLLVFLARRYRKKDGLVIALKEPNYYDIAWGVDTTLWWKIPSDAERYEVLERHLSRQDFLLQTAISFNCPATEQDALAKAMVYIASAHHLAASMIQTCIRYEVQTCLSENTLFRNNSVASKMYKFFSRIVGIKYLFHCIARVIKELEVLGQRQINAADAGAAAAAAQSSGGKNGKNSPAGSVDVSLLTMTMELDQTKVLGDDLDTDTNLLQLQLICQKLLNVIIKTSVRNIPADFRKIFIEIDNSVMSKFGSNDAVYKGIGGLFFLRFICPALTAPHVYGLLETPPNQVTQRQLVLITKVVQSIANMQEPGKKEEYMVALRDFIVKSIPKITTFYDNLRAAVNLSENIENYETTVIDVPEEVKMNGLAAVANFLHTETPKLRAWTETEACPFDDMAKSELHQMLDEVQNTYPKPPKKASGSSGASATSELESGKKKKKSKK